MDFQDVAHASELHNSTSTTDTASNPQSFEKKVNNSTHEDVQNAASPSQSIPLKNLENTTKLNPNFDAEPLTITATVIVTEGNGILNANVSYAYDSDDDNNQAFTNYYVTPKQLDFDVHFTKSLVGRPLNNGEFQFTMKMLTAKLSLLVQIMRQVKLISTLLKVNVQLIQMPMPVRPSRILLKKFLVTYRI